MKIITRNDNPPIPTNAFDWSAVLDGYDGAPDSPTRGQIGHGATEQQAIDELKEILNWCERCNNDGTIIDKSEVSQWNPTGEVTCPDCCSHDEKDHGICLECKKDCFQDDVAAAEFRADCINDR